MDVHALCVLAHRVAVQPHVRFSKNAQVVHLMLHTDCCELCIRFDKRVTNVAQIFDTSLGEATGCKQLLQATSGKDISRARLSVHKQFRE
jgi:hypothetical protein